MLDPLLGASKQALLRRCIRLEAALSVVQCFLETDEENQRLIEGVTSAMTDMTWKTPQLGDEDYKSGHSVDADGNCNMGCC